MTAPDFAAIIAPWQTFTASDGAAGIRIREASELLAARVPALCPTCEDDDSPPLDCPDCPTIGRLLAIGAAVMTGIVDVPPVTFGGTPNWQARDRADGAAWMLAQLRAVQP